MKTEPELLQHPNIPKPLHGLSPRSIKGKEWWDETRRRVYAERDYHCFACGIHKSEAWPDPWLECHEDYTIDYPLGLMTINRFVALCPACHNFIHSGRLSVVDVSHQVKLDIMEYGWALLRRNRLAPSAATVALVNAGKLPEPKWWPASFHIATKYKRGPDWQIVESAPWGNWRLRLGGEEYFSKFENIQDWAEHYRE